jgi:hypothetical protein
VDGLAIRFGDDVLNDASSAFRAFQSGFCGRRLRQGPHDDDAIDAQAGCFVLTRGDDADARHRNTTVADELSRDAIDDVDRDCKADARRCAGPRDDRTVHTDQPTGAVEQRAAGIAGIDRRIGLDQAADLMDVAVGNRRCSALMMPEVRVCSRP